MSNEKLQMFARAMAKVADNTDLDLLTVEERKLFLAFVKDMQLKHGPKMAARSKAETTEHTYPGDFMEGLKTRPE